MKLGQTVSPHARWLGIRSEYTRVSRKVESGLPARVIAITEHGPTREMKCRLMDGSTLYVRRPWNEPLPAVGSRLSLVLPGHHIIPLSDVAGETTLRDCLRPGVTQLDLSVAEIG